MTLYVRRRDWDPGSSVWAIEQTYLGQSRKENYELFILDSCTNLGARSILIYGTMGMKPSPMSDEFHDWLESCPVQWFRGEVTKDHVAYYFETPDEDEE